MPNENGTLFAVGVVGVLAVAAKALGGDGRSAGSRSMYDDLMKFDRASRSEGSPRSVVADGLVPVGHHENSWRPGPWVSMDPIEGYEGSGPVLLVGLKSAYAWRDTTGTGIVAPGYPALRVRKRGSIYQLVRPTQARGRPGRAKYAAQTIGKITMYPNRREVAEAQRVMHALSALLNEASSNGAQVEVLQAIGLLILWRRNPIEQSPVLEEAVAQYLLRSDVSVPNYIHHVSDDAETTEIVVERSYGSAPDHLSGGQLRAGRGHDEILAKTIGAALRRRLTAAWTSKAPQGAPTIRPQYTDSDGMVNFVSDGTYALRQTSADWLTAHTPLGRKRSKAKVKTWLNSTNKPDLNSVLMGNHDREVRLVGWGNVVGAGPVVVLQSRGGPEIVVAANKIATVLARALHAGGKVHLTSDGSALGPVLVHTQSHRFEGVVMPVRVDT